MNIKLSSNYAYVWDTNDPYDDYVNQSSEMLYAIKDKWNGIGGATVAAATVLAMGGSAADAAFAAAQEALVTALTDMGAEVDEEIISKMTGKAAQYFTSVLTNAA